MAVTRDRLIIEITAEGKAAKKAFEAVGKSVQKFGKGIDSTSKKLSVYDKSVAAAATSTEPLNSSLEDIGDQKKIFDPLTKTANNLNASLGFLQTTIDSLTVILSTKLIKDFAELNENLTGANEETEKFNKNLQSVGKNIGNAASSLQKISAGSKEIVELSKVSKDANVQIKQLGSTAASSSQQATDSFNSQRETIEVLGDEFENFGSTYDDTLGELVTRAEAATTAQNATLASVKVLGLAFKASGLILTKIFTPGLAGVAEKADTLGPILAEVGSSLRKTDSAAAQISGTISLLSGFALVAFSAALNFAFFQIGKLTQSLGVGLFLAMRAMEIRFIKFEKTLRQFRFGVENFGESIGVVAVGSLKLWEKQLEQTVKTTRFSIAQIARAIKLLIAEGTAIGLTVAENTKLLKRSADVAAFTGRKVEDVTLALLSALTGNAQAALALGIDLRELALIHTELFIASGKTFNALSEQEKVQIRLNQIFKKTRPLVGAAADDLKSFAGKTTQLIKAIDLLAIRIGKMGVASEILITIALGLVSAFEKLPSPIIEFIGNLIDLGGITLIIVGTTLKYILIITTLITTFKVLNAIVKLSERGQLSLQNVIAETLVIISRGAVKAKAALVGLGASFTAVNQRAKAAMTGMFAFGAATGGFAATFVAGFAKVTQSVKNFGKSRIDIAALTKSVKTSAGFFQKFAAILKLGGARALILVKNIARLKNINVLFTKTLKLLIFSLFSATTVVLFFGKALKVILLFIGPLLLKIALFVASVKAILIAFNEVSKNSTAFQRVFENIRGIAITFAESMGIAGASVKDFGELIKDITSDTLQRFFKVLVDISKLLIGGFSVSILRVSQVFLLMKKLFAGSIEETAELDIGIGKLGEEIAQMTGVVQTAIGGLFSLGEELALASDKMDEFTKKTKKAVESLIILGLRGKQIGPILGETLRIEAFGTDFERAIRIAKNARIEFDKVSALVEKGKASVDELGEAQIKAGKAYLDITRLQREALAAFDQQNRDFEIQRLKDTGDLIGAIKLQNAERLKGFNEQISGLKLLEGFTGKRIINEDKLRKIFESQQAARLEGAREQQGVSPLIANISAALATGAAFFTNIFSPSNFETLGSFFENTFNTDNFSELASSFEESISGVLTDFAAITSDLISGFSSGINIVSSVFSPSKFQGLALTFGSGLADFFDNLLGAMADFSKSLTKFIQDFPEAFTKFLDKLPEVLKSLFDQLPALIDVFADALIGLFEKLPEILQPIIDGLIAGFLQLLDRLPEIITAFLDALPEIVSQLANALPGLIIGILDKLPDIIVAIIEGLIANAADIVVALVEAFIIHAPGIGAAIAKFILIGLPVAILEGFALGIDRLFKSIIGIFSEVRIPAIENIAEDLEEGIVKISRKITDATSQIFKVSDLKLEARGIDAADRIRIAISSSINRGAIVIASLWSRLGGIVAKAWQWVINNIFLPFAAIVSKAWTWVVDNILAPLAGFVEAAWLFVREIFESLGSVVSEAWKTVVEMFEKIPEIIEMAWATVIELFENLGEIVATAWRAVLVLFDQLENIVNRAWRFVLNVFENFTGIILGAWDKILNLFDDFGNVIFKAWEFLLTFFDSLKDKVKNAFRPIFKAWKIVFDFFRDTFSNLFSNAFKPIREFLEKFKFPEVKVPGVSDSGRIEGGIGQVADFLGFQGAQGGVVNSAGIRRMQAGGPLGSDTVPAFLSPGEFVVNRRGVDSLGAGILGRANRGQSVETGTQIGELNVNINAAGANIDESFIRNRMMPTIREELRRSSLEGRRILASTGVR